MNKSQKYVFQDVPNLEYGDIYDIKKTRFATLCHLLAIYKLRLMSDHM